MNEEIATTRTTSFLYEDLLTKNSDLSDAINGSSFLVLGGGGSIGQALVKELVKFSPKVVHVVDINENNLTELTRDIRSSQIEFNGEFKTFTIDVGSKIFEKFLENSYQYD